MTRTKSSRTCLLDFALLHIEKSWDHHLAMGRVENEIDKNLHVDHTDQTDHSRQSKFSKAGNKAGNFESDRFVPVSWCRTHSTKSF